MSGETERDISGWTVDTLHIHLRDLISELDRRVEQRFDLSKERVDQRFLASQEKVELALVCADKAVSKAEMATEKRFESVNEFRQTLADQARELVSRNEFNTKFESLDVRMSDLASRNDRRDGTGTGRKDMWGYIVGAVGLALTLLSIIAVVVKFSGTTSDQRDAPRSQQQQHRMEQT